MAQLRSVQDVSKALGKPTCAQHRLLEVSPTFAPFKITETNTGFAERCLLVVRVDVTRVDTQIQHRGDMR